MDAASSFPNLTAGSGFFAWLGVLSATTGLVMFYRCSRYAILNLIKALTELHQWHHLLGLIS